MQATENIRARGPVSAVLKGMAPEADVIHETKTLSLNGLWRSQGGSLYYCDGQSFTCISVHSSQFIGWIGKIAVRDLHQSGDDWHGWQAFRDMRTGKLASWQRLRLTVSDDVVTKFFSVSPGSGHLVYGPVETYYRIVVH